MVLFGFAVALAVLATSVIASPTTNVLVSDIDKVTSQVRSLNSTFQEFFKSPNNAVFESVLEKGLQVHSGVVKATNDAGHTISKTDAAAVVAALRSSGTVVSSTLNYLTASYEVIEHNDVYVKSIAKALVLLTIDVTRFGIVLAVNIPCDLRGDVEPVSDTYLQAFSLALQKYV